MLKFVISTLLIIIPIIVVYFYLKKNPFELSCIACDGGSWWYKCKEGTGVKKDKNGNIIKSQGCQSYEDGANLPGEIVDKVTDMYDEAKKLPDGVVGAVGDVKDSLSKLSGLFPSISFDPIKIPPVDFSCELNKANEGINEICAKDKGAKATFCGGRDTVIPGSIDPCGDIASVINFQISGITSGFNKMNTAVTGAFKHLGDTIDHNMIDPVKERFVKVFEPVTKIGTQATAFFGKLVDTFTQLFEHIIDILMVIYMKYINPLLPFSPAVNLAIFIFIVLLPYSGGVISFFSFIGQLIQNIFGATKGLVGLFIPSGSGGGKMMMRKKKISIPFKNKNK